MDAGPRWEAGDLDHAQREGSLYILAPANLVGIAYPIINRCFVST